MKKANVVTGIIFLALSIFAYVESLGMTFSDTASIPAYATYYIQTMAAQGVISGYADGTFQPGANITRGQMAKILYNLM